MVDRKARDKLAGAIEAYLAGEIDRWEFDVRVVEMGNADDDTVRHLAAVMDFFCDKGWGDEYKKTRCSWNLLYRCLLVLKSDAVLEPGTVRRIRHAGQVVAALSLLGYVIVALHVGFSVMLLPVTAMFGIIAVLISLLPNPRTRGGLDWQDEAGLLPFSCLSEVFAVRRSVPEFRKRAFPGADPNDPDAEALPPRWLNIYLPRTILCMALAPVVLAFQCFPDRETKVRVVFPAAAAG